MNNLNISNFRLKKTDLDRALVRGLRRGAWETKQARMVKEQVHLNPKKKKIKHKKPWTEIEND